MSAENKKQQLRSMLAGKSTAELEELLALEAANLDAAEPNADFIATVLEVMAERESAQDEEMTEQAWKDFQEYYNLRKQEETEPDNDEEAPHDHRRKTEHRQRSPKLIRVIRIGVVAAVLVVLLCGTAFGWNFFQAVADWTEETFQFLTGLGKNMPENQSALNLLQLSVEKKTDTPAVPKWAPEETVENGSPKESGRTDRFSVFASYTVENREFTVLITIHDMPPEVYTITYQKNSEIEEEYLAGGITHYIMGNTETLSAMWINGNVEGCLQGELTLEELRQMIDSSTRSDSMKKRLLTLLFAVLLLSSLSTIAYASNARASAYFCSTDVRAYAKSGGKILFEVDINATHTMQEVGASEIYVYEQQDDGSWDNVYTFTMDDHPYLIETNTAGAFVDATYQGTVGKDYYAAVACYAKDSNGYECLYFNTNVVTAKLIVW